MGGAENSKKGFGRKPTRITIVGIGPAQKMGRDTGFFGFGAITDQSQGKPLAWHMF